MSRTPTGYYTRGKTHPVHARTGPAKVRNPSGPTGASGQFVFNPSRRTKILEGGLHPTTAGASEQERVQLSGQALTHAQKEHLAEFSGLSPTEQHSHLVGFHADLVSPPTLRQISGFSNGIPQYRDVPVAGVQSSYIAHHLTLHQQDLAERKASRRSR